MPTKRKRKLTPLGRVVVVSGATVASITVVFVGFCLIMSVIDPPTPAERAAWAAEAAERSAAREAKRLSDRHAAWRKHAKDTAFGALARASGCGSICVMGSTGDGIDADAEALVDQEEAAHPDAWKSYEPD